MYAKTQYLPYNSGKQMESLNICHNPPATNALFLDSIDPSPNGSDPDFVPRSKGAEANIFFLDVIT